MRRLVAATAALILVIALAGPATAANPNKSYEFTACWNGTQVVMEQAWSGINVDEVSFGLSADGVGLGAIYPIPRSRSGDETSAESPPTDPPADTAGGDLRFHGRVVASDSVPIPGGDPSALPAC